ncbi:MAG: hypothetical protein H7Y11_06000 [Armatimonadetes bacterium]|nr:hypothetical protein [Anaerolineae bacterium]
MHKRERLEKTIAGEVTDRVPVAVWRSFPGDDQRAADFANSVIGFQQRYDWDFVTLYPANHYAVVDYGLQDEWRGAASGERTALKLPIKRSLDWTELRPLDPVRGEYGKVLEAARLVLAACQADQTPVIVAVYSPLAQASRLAGNSAFIQQQRKHPDRVRTGLNTLTESTLRFLELLKPLGIAGVYYMIEHADYEQFTESEYDAVGLPYDRRILDALPAEWWLNMVHLRGAAPMLRFTSSYRAQALNCQDTSQPLPELRAQFGGALCGGLDAEQHLHLGTPTVIRDAARHAMQQMNSRHLMLTGSGAAAVTTPLSHLRAARSTVEGV